MEVSADFLHVQLDFVLLNQMLGILGKDFESQVTLPHFPLVFKTNTN